MIRKDDQAESATGRANLDYWSHDPAYATAQEVVA